MFTKGNIKIKKNKESDNPFFQHKKDSDVQVAQIFLGKSDNITNIFGKESNLKTLKMSHKYNWLNKSQDLSFQIFKFSIW